MRCAFCSRHLSREKPGVAGPGVVLCYECVALANDIANGRLAITTPAHDRPAWGLVLMDPGAMELLDDDALRTELAIAKEIAQPLNDFIAAAEQRLVGDPNWRSASSLPLSSSSSNRHVHDERVMFPNGASLVARSFGGVRSYVREQLPDFGWYFASEWSPPWPHEYVAWPDFGVPVDAHDFVERCGSVLTRIEAGETVEIGCLGGHGRTGTALAVLAAMCGVAQAEAVAWVRANYCEQAVETVEQAQFVLSVRLP